MTQYYKMPRFTLANANASTKVLLTLYLCTVLSGLAVALLQYADRAGFSDHETRTWMLGNEGDVAASEIRSEKSYRELLAITHDHAFALPMLVFLLLHLVALTTVPEGAKIVLYVAGFASLAGSLAGPWLIRYRGPEWSAPFQAAGAGLGVTIGGAALLCLFEMWLARPLRRLRGRAEPRAPDPLARRPEAEGSD